MIRFLFRVLATLTLAAAVVMAVLDATRSVAASSLVMTPLMESWEATFPASLAALKDFLTARIGAFAWDPTLVSLLGLPGFAVLGAVAFLLYAVGYRPRSHQAEWGR